MITSMRNYKHPRDALERLDLEEDGAVISPYRMAAMIERARKRLSKRAKKGFRGWPVATVALYGPDHSTATKLTVGIVPADAAATDLRRWFSKDQTDIRDDFRVAEEVLAFITEAGAKSVAMTDRIIGCPHEEGIDYEGNLADLSGLRLLGGTGPLDRRTPALAGC